MVYSNKIISLLTQASYQGWFANETTVRSTNYSIDPLATALFNDPFVRFDIVFTNWKHLQDNIILLRDEIWTHNTV
jgi:hypothetical protein